MLSLASDTLALPDIASAPATISAPAGRPLNAIVKRLFGVHLTGDVRERLCGVGIRPPLTTARRARLAGIRDAGALFIHIPKNAGMSVSNALYGLQVKHASVRYYDCVAPDLLDSLPSFALIRDPRERFLSAWRYGRAGGTAHNRVSMPFRPVYMAFSSIDAALDHLESVRSIYAVDHIFRPQSWYITDREGEIMVDRLFLLSDMARASAAMPHLLPAAIPHLNRTAAGKTILTLAQEQRLRALYPQDFRLFEMLSAHRPWL
ncbi:sulfotransferase family 2 domain-containing protein [Sphingobium aquiterrae]|uniref:sulfotransferase family 2 domain-containing protein n=1 Tax=Sphingobium aquiterrae TaxID=2038656 RepID=UPI00301B2D28